MKRWNIAMTGFGGVGRAIATLLHERHERYRALFGADVRLTGVRRSRTLAIDLDGFDRSAQIEARFAEAPLSDDFLAMSEADVLIEAGPSDFRTGGPGLGYMRAALEHGRHVIAVSKGALVHDGPALQALAAAQGLALEVSGAAAAALPTIDLIRHSLAGCEILGIEGILNATSNYLLDAMSERGTSLADALAEAQRAGIAEADPRLDIEGWDTACKILIIANMGLGLALRIDEMEVSGVQNVDSAQIEAWREASVIPKLVGYVRREEAGISAGVELRTYPRSDPFALVHGKNKAIRIVSDAMGEIVATGGGSEPRATAAAALKDLEHILARTVQPFTSS